MQRPAERTYLRYPGADHVLRYLRLAVDGSREQLVEGLMPVLDDLCDGGGALRLGAMGLFADYVAGNLALQTVAPDWTVTHDMALHWIGAVPAGLELEATCTLVRAGKNNVVSETSLVAPGHGEVGRAYVTFTRIARREGMLGSNPHPVVNLAEEGERPRRPLDDAVGFRLGTSASGAAHVEFDHDPFIHNSVGAIQGGVVALALERATSWAAESRHPGRTYRPVDLHLHYLALGRDGPFQARTEVLRDDGATVVSRVALVDTGNDDRLLALGVGTAVPL